MYPDTSVIGTWKGHAFYTNQFTIFPPHQVLMVLGESYSAFIEAETKCKI